MQAHQTTARLVGLLFITATVLGLAAVGVAPPGGDPAATAADGNRAATAALLEVLMGLTVAAIAIVVFPVLRLAGERLAIAYVASRTVEGVLSVVSALAALAFLSVGQELVAGSSADEALAALGMTLVATRDWVNYAALPIVFAVSAVLLNGGLFRARLVPRWLSGWGLLGAVPYLAWGLLALYGQEEIPVLAAPLGLQELALALWLIVRGFDIAALTRGMAASPPDRSVTELHATMAAMPATPQPDGGAR